MDEKRTEEQRLCQDPLKVILGGREYSLPPLTIIEARAWRVEFAEVLKTLPELANKDGQTNLNSLFIEVPDMAADLFWAYAKGLDRTKIERKATEGELTIAFEQVIEYARPLGLTKSLTKVIPQILQ